MVKRYKNTKKQKIIYIQQDREEKFKAIKSCSNNGKEINGEKIKKIIH